MVTFVFDKYCIFDKATWKHLMEAAKEPWTGGRIQPILFRINKLEATYARHHITLREDKKLDLSVEVIKLSALLATDCSKWRKKDEADKTWANFQTHFKKAARDLKYQQSVRIGGFANAEQEAANMAADTIERQATATENAHTLVQHSKPLCVNYANRVAELEAQVAAGGGGGGDGGGGGRDSNRLPKANFNQLLQMATTKMRYCWSCGICAHSSDYCSAAKYNPGHKTEAMETNRLSGATAVPSELAAVGLKLK